MYAVEYVSEQAIKWYMEKTYHVRLWKDVLRIDKGIPVKWFYIIKNEYKRKYNIKEIIVE